MDPQREAIVTRGLGQLHTGLGMLVGSGRISHETHQAILDLISVDECSPHPGRAGKETPVSLQSSELEAGIGPPPRGPGRSISSLSPRLNGESQWPNGPSSQKVLPPEIRRSNIQCPWWSTPGYKCRENDKGQCAWVHEDIPNGVNDPLICSFWADGQRCNKSDDECRFAHYWAQHRQIAPQPNSKYKKSKGHSAARDQW